VAVSTIPALRTAILARFAAETWPTATPQLARSHPFPVHTEGELIYLLGTRNDDPVGTSYGGGQKPAQFGTQKNEERYVQIVVVSVVDSAMADVAVMEARAFELAGVIETNIRNWRTTATPYDGIVRWALVTGLALDGPHLIAAESKQSLPSREVLITIDIACSARI
jgi:hypothetical protein